MAQRRDTRFHSELYSMTLTRSAPTDTHRIRLPHRSLGGAQATLPRHLFQPMKMPLWSVFRGFFPVFDLFCSLIIHYMQSFVKSFFEFFFFVDKFCTFKFCIPKVSTRPLGVICRGGRVPPAASFLQKARQKSLNKGFVKIIFSLGPL